MRTGCPGSWLVMSMDFALEHRTSPVMRADRQRNPRCFSTGKSLPHPKECGGKPVKNREKQVFHNCLPVFEVAGGTRAFRSRCQHHRKRGSQRDGNGCKTLRSRLRCWLRLAHRTTTGQTPANCLDKQARFFQNSTQVIIKNKPAWGNKGRKLFSRNFLPLFQVCTARVNQTGGKTKKGSSG